CCIRDPSHAKPVGRKTISGASSPTARPHRSMKPACTSSLSRGWRTRSADGPGNTRPPTGDVVQLDIHLQTHSDISVHGADRYVGAPKSEVMLRCTQSLVASLNHAEGDII